MKTNVHFLIILMFACCSSVSMTGCGDYLDARPDQKLVVPGKIQDLQGLLDYYARVNNFQPSAAEVSADDYYLTTADWLAIAKEQDRRMYVWEKDNLFAEGYGDWSYTYDNVYRANVVLDNLGNIKIAESDRAALNNLKGQALVLRARAFLSVASIWAPAYDGESAGTDPGIPLRLNSDFNVPSVRSTVGQTYEQILKDLTMAVPLLPDRQIHVMRAGKAAAYALLARTCLFMRHYREAGLYADSCLAINHTLIDFNSLNSAATYPIKQFNDEVLLSTRMQIPSFLANSRAKIDSMLYRSYDNSDLRKKVFFKNNNNGSYGFKGSYDGTAYPFDGLATDEIYLMRAECYARAGQVAEAIADLNTLMIKRWDKTKPYVPFSAGTPEEALSLILRERRKELLMRGLRWMDIKRLNKESAGIDLKRIVAGREYTLPANDLRFALPIPEDVISLSGMKQNPR